MDQLITADAVLYSIIGFILLKKAVDVYIITRQMKVCKTSKTVPKVLERVMNEQTFNRARLYSLHKLEFSIFTAISLDVIFTTQLLYSGLIAFIWQIAEFLADLLSLNSGIEIVVSCLFIVILNLFYLVARMPFLIYAIFVLEEKHGFNNQTVGYFVIDQIRGLFISLVFEALNSAATVFLVQQGGQYFYIWLWLFMAVTSFILIITLPILMAILFGNYQPLEEGSLKESIKKLASSVKFPLTKIYVVEGSRRSAHSNAYFSGLWYSKRIVIYDTLLKNKRTRNEADLNDEERDKGCTDMEILAVLGHELGHWKLDHVTKIFVLKHINLLIMCIAFGYLFPYGQIYEAIGFEPGKKPILAGFLLVMLYVLAPYRVFVSIWWMMLSRRFEYQADKFAHKLGFSEHLGTALIKIHIDNLAFPVYDWLYVWWFHSHPTLLQRLDRLKELAEATKAK